MKKTTAEQRDEKDDAQEKPFLEGPVGELLTNLFVAVATGFCFAIGSRAGESVLRPSAPVVPLKRVS